MSSKKEIKLTKKKSAIIKNDYHKWVIKAILLSFFISAALSFVSEVLLRNVQVLVAFIILVIIITIGILFDIIGVAVTAANETPFHSMSSRKIMGAKTAVALIRDAGKISSLCNDVVGDVCGILSGAAGAVIIGKIIILQLDNKRFIYTIVLSSIIASFTVGGKAIGKQIAISHSNAIVYRIGFLIERFKSYFNL